MHRDLMLLVPALHIFNQNLHIFQPLYYNQTAVIRHGNNISSRVAIKRSVRQDWVQWLDKINSEQGTIWHLEDSDGVNMSGVNTMNITDAGDTKARGVEC